MLNFLRDPIWSTIGVLITVLGLFFSYGQSSKTSEMSVIYNDSVDFNEYLLPDKKVQLLVEGKAKNLDKVIISYFSIYNSSDLPIKPEDYKAPISVSAGKEVKHIISVDSCSEKLTEECTEQGENSSSIPAKWENENNQWNMTPLLLNPKESTCVMITWERDKDIVKKDAKNFIWQSRIVNVDLITYPSPREFAQKSQKSASVIAMSIAVVLFGSGIYWFVLLFSIVFISTLYAAFRAEWVKDYSVVTALKILGFALMSLTTSEILIDLIINNHSLKDQHPIVWPLLGIQIIMAVFIFYKAIRKTVQRA